MFMTVSHWSLDHITDELIADAEAEFMPMILDTGAEQLAASKSDEEM